MTGRIGDDALRPDAPAKAAGTFDYAGDLTAPGMLHAATLRCPYPSARLVRLDTSRARALPGVVDVVTAAEVPGMPAYGLDTADQPVFVSEVARHHGEPVAAVAAGTPEQARRALDAVDVTWEPLAPVTDPERALAGPPLHPDGNVFRRLLLEHGNPHLEGEVVVEATYDVRMQDQAFLAPEAALARPDGRGGVWLQVATQWLHSDQGQVAACLGLRAEQVQVTLAGVGGAFGGREDVTLQIHVCLLALRTGRPVKLVYSREDSFLGHAHRHPARLHYRHTATRDGRLVSVRARLVFDGGAYASSSYAVVGNAVTMGAGPYAVPNVRLEGLAVRTNNPPAGAMRGFGVVQVCAAHEAQMDRLAAAVGLDPVEVRRRNALSAGDVLPTGQRVHGVAPVAALLDRLAEFPLPPAGPPEPHLLRPGGAGDCGDPARTRRGVGMALGFKNIGFSEGYDDPATARVRLELGPDGAPRAVVQTACAEVGQGFVTLAQQIVRTELEVDAVVLLDADTGLPSAGSTSASRQSWVSGGAVRLAAAAVAADLERRNGPLVDLLAAGPVEAERTFRHRPTAGLDARGQGDAHVAWSFVAHRAVVDVDVDLGTVRLVQLATVQDVGRALNPLATLGQLEGGAAQGVGLALMEELVLADGTVTDPSLEGYKIPTMLDLPDLLVALVEEPEPDAPYGGKGLGEAPTITSGAAVMAALRDATGLPLTRLPVRAQDLVAP